MKSLRLPCLLAIAGVSAMLSGCVVAPLGAHYGGYNGYRGGPSVYVEPAPVVVVPAPGYGYRGYRHWR